MGEEKNTLSILFLDAMTTTKQRMTSFKPTITECIQDLRKWANDNNVTSEQMAYADIYEKIGKANPINIGFVKMDCAGNFIVGKPVKPKPFIARDHASAIKADKI